MLDFEKASINALEEDFLAVVSGIWMLLPLLSKYFRKSQSKGLTNQYMEDPEFAVTMRMRPSLAFVPEHDVSDCFLILMADFPQCVVEIAEYFEETYIGKRLPDQTRRIPPFPIRMWNMYHRVIDKTARTNNAVEGWYNAFQSSISCSHPSFPKFVKLLREQWIKDVKYAKWEGGNFPLPSKLSIEREQRLYNLVSDYSNRDLLTYLRGIAHNLPSDI